MRTMEFSFHKVANYAAISVFLCSVLLISGTSTVQAENNAWVFKSPAEFGADIYNEWVVEAWGTKTEYSVSLWESQLKSTTKHTHWDGVVNQDVEFIFDYYTPPEVLVPGYDQGYLVIGTSTGNPYHYTSSESFMSYVFTWNNSGDVLERIYGMQMDLDQENQSAVAPIAFKIPDLVDGQLSIKVRLGIGAQFYVQFWYEPGTVALEDTPFVLINDGQGPVELNGKPLPSGESEKFVESNSVTLEKNARVTLNRDCVAGLRHLLDIIYLDNVPGQTRLFAAVALTSLLLADDLSICAEEVNETAAKATGNNQVTLELHLGAGRFQSVRSDLEVNIETGAATVNSISQNDFAVGSDPDADLTIAACYKGSVTVAPTNTALSGVTLEAGQYVKVTSNTISPIYSISTTSPGSFLLLLNDDGK